MEKIEFFICFLCLLMVGFESSGQLQQIENGDREAKLHNYRNAIASYKEALDKSPYNYQLFKKLGDCYRLSGNCEPALQYYEKCMITGKFHEEDSVQYARLLLSNGKPEKAGATFRELLQRYPDDKELKRMVDCCNFAVYQLSRSDLPPVSNVEQLNSPQSEQSLAIFGSCLIYASTRLNRDFFSIDKDMAEGNSDFYIACYNQKSQKFDNPTRLINNLNSTTSEVGFTFSPLTKTAFLSRCDDDSGRYRIYTAKLKGNRWVEIKPVQIGVQGFKYMHPSLSDDGKYLFFTSDMPGGYGGKDIWKATVSYSGMVTDPVNLGPAVNTDKDEAFPYIAGDSVLFFSSEGHVGMGDMDIFMAGIREKQIGNPVNLGAPINSTRDDFSMILNENGNGGYFCSNRKPDQQDDIFSFTHNIFMTGNIFPEKVIETPEEMKNFIAKPVTADSVKSKPARETKPGKAGLSNEHREPSGLDSLDSAMVPENAILYRIQVIASAQLVNPEKRFSTISDIIDTYGLSVDKVNKLYKYRIGNFSSEKDALSVQQILRKRGFKDCFIIIF